VGQLLDHLEARVQPPPALRQLADRCQHYLGAVAATFWLKRITSAEIAGTVTGAASTGPVNQVVPNSTIQLILPWICMAFLILVALPCCGWTATRR
jgi:hypothetical protein